jgi:hypothetical protein
MSTLAQMRSRIADAINRTDLNTQIDLAINRAIQHYYNAERFWFQETSGTFSTIANQEAYGTADGIPSDIDTIDEVKITLASTNIQPLVRRSFDWIIAMNQGQATGDPTDYSWYQNKIYLYLIPNQVRTVTLYYTKTYTALSGDSDTNDYTTYVEDLIEARAQSKLYDEILGNVDSAQRAKTRELESLAALRARTGNMVMMGQIVPTQF